MVSLRFVVLRIMQLLRSRKWILRRNFPFRPSSGAPTSLSTEIRHRNFNSLLSSFLNLQCTWMAVPITPVWTGTERGIWTATLCLTSLDISLLRELPSLTYRTLLQGIHNCCIARPLCLAVLLSNSVSQQCQDSTICSFEQFCKSLIQDRSLLKGFLLLQNGSSIAYDVSHWHL